MSGTSPWAVYAQSAAEKLGWPGRLNHGEAKLAIALSRIGHGPNEVQVQFNIGQFRLDFAFPRWRIGLEADGWVHTAQSVEKRDKERDRILAEWGWTILRIDVQGDIDAEMLKDRLFWAKTQVAADAQAYWSRATEEMRVRRQRG